MKTALSIVFALGLVGLGVENALAQGDPLSRLLKQYPGADSNGDGKLSIAEAKAFRDARARSSSSAAKSPSESSVAVAPAPTHENVRYGKWARNVLDLWMPESEQPTPLLVFIHGGGFVGGNKESVRSKGDVQYSLQRGVAFASIQYRFLYPEGTKEFSAEGEFTSIQNILRDSARAIQFLRANAKEFNLDPARIACYGGSAGAGTSIWLAFHDDLAEPDSSDPVLRQSSRIAAAGMINGQFTYDLEQWDDAFEDLGGDIRKTHGNGRERTVGRFFGLTEQDFYSPLGEKWRADVDMRGLVTADDPPVCILTSNPDKAPTTRGIYNHHPRHAELIEQQCKIFGCEVLCLLPKVRDEDARTLQEQPNAMIDFLLKHVMK